MTLANAQIGDVPDIVAAMTEIGLPIDEAAVSRYFFTSEGNGTTECLLGGLVARDDAGRVVGYCGLTPCAVYVNGERHEAYQMGILGVRQGCGTVMFDFMDRVGELTRRALVFANTANEKSVRLWTQYAGFSSGPPLCAYIQYAFLPLGFFTRPRFSRHCDFLPSDFRHFLKEYQADQRGIMSERTQKRLTRIFGPAIQDGRVVVITAKEAGGVVGYAALRIRPLNHFRLLRYEIIDILALGDKAEIIKRLVVQCRRFASCHGGIVLEYVGGKKLLPHCRPALANTFIWAGGSPDVQHAIKSGNGWFFGPYDGDRSMS